MVTVVVISAGFLPMIPLNDDLVLVLQDLMFQDLKGPVSVKCFIQSLNNCVTLHIVQCLAKVAVPLFDLVRRKTFF